MKYLLILAVLLMCFSALSEAQTLAADSSYASSGNTLWVSFDGSGTRVLSVRFKDSVNVKLYFDYKRSNTDSVYQTYTLVSDSTNSTNAAGCWLSYMIRTGSTNSIPAGRYGRLRWTRLTTKNGVSTPTFDAELVEY